MRFACTAVCTNQCTNPLESQQPQQTTQDNTPAGEAEQYVSLLAQIATAINPPALQVCCRWVYCGCSPTEMYLYQYMLDLVHTLSTPTTIIPQPTTTPNTGSVWTSHTHRPHQHYGILHPPTPIHHHGTLYLHQTPRRVYQLATSACPAPGRPCGAPACAGKCGGGCGTHTAVNHCSTCWRRVTVSVFVFIWLFGLFGFAFSVHGCRTGHGSQEYDYWFTLHRVTLGLASEGCILYTLCKASHHLQFSKHLDQGKMMTIVRNTRKEHQTIMLLYVYHNAIML